ncbi:MAG: hypothetical protein R3B72_42415 [Polyangiaceae bacterium]
MRAGRARQLGAWLMVMGLALVALGCATSGDPRVTTLDHARFVLSSEPKPPADEAFGPAIALPDRWSASRPRTGGTGFYRFTLAPQPDAVGAWAVLVPDLNMNAEIFLDGVWIGSGGRMTEPVAQHWNRPLFFPFDASLVKDGAVIDVRLFAYAGDWGGLGPVRVGPEAPLRASYEALSTTQVGASQVASVLALVMVVLFGALWLAKRREPMYGYFVAAAGCFFVHSLAYHLRDIVFPFWFARWGIHVALDWFGVWQLRAFHRWLKVQAPRLEAAVLGVVALGSLVTLAMSLGVGPVDGFIPSAVAFHVPVALLLPYALVQIARRWRSLPRAEAGVVLAGSLGTTYVAFHALLAHLGLLPQSAPRMLFLLGPILLFCFGALMLADFLRTFRSAQDLNVELDRRVKEKEAALAENYDRLRKLEAERLLAEERERIMREMHDGLGSNLVSALSSLEGGQGDREAVAHALREALVDMRVVIDSLDPSVDDLATMLGMLRSRLAPRLAKKGPQVKWQVQDLPPIPGWGPRHTLHVMRIVQEAITNTLKHAKATTLGVATGVDESAFVRIWDDGVGVTDRGSSGGRGLANMQYRAAALGAQVAVETRDAGGTTVTLWLPSRVAE